MSGGGSKKGEHRGNARKRPLSRMALERRRYKAAHKRYRKPYRKRGGPTPPETYTEKTRRYSRTHETPAEVMDDIARALRADPVVVERRITVARIINGPSDNVEDMTPKEVLLDGMRHHMGAVRDFKLMLEAISEQPVTPETIAKCNALDAEIERGYDKAGEFAFKVAPFMHSKMTTIANAPTAGENQITVLELLINEIDELERSKPIPIEHKPAGKAG